MEKWLHDIHLEGELVNLIPLKKEHRNSLVKAASDGALWKLWFTSVPSEDTIDNYIEFALREKENGRSLPFVVVDKKTNQIIGSTRFCNAINNNRVEIGYTWYGNSYQKTGANTACKILLLTYAFEQLNCIAVEFRTHWHNHPSRNAILRLGAKQDGVLRNHQISDNGVLRDTVVFSILRDEWKAVKKSILHKMKNN